MAFGITWQAIKTTPINTIHQLEGRTKPYAYVIPPPKYDPKHDSSKKPTMTNL